MKQNRLLILMLGTFLGMPNSTKCVLPEADQKNQDILWNSIKNSWGKEDNLVQLLQTTPIDILNNEDGESILHRLSLGVTDLNTRKAETLLNLIFDKGKWSNLNVLNRNYGQTPLYLAAENLGRDHLQGMAKMNFSLEMLRKLLALGANPNIASTSNTTPLHIAAENGNLEGISALLKAGAKTNVQNKYGNTPLMSAERSTKPGIKGKRYQAIGIIKDWIEEHGETK